MPNRSSDALFQLVHSLQKGEKRNFKLYVQRNSDNEDLKIVQLFDALDKMKEYNEQHLLRKNPSIKKMQLSNIKAHLYRQLLASLRVLESDANIDIQLHEQLDYARILYNKGLYLQSLKILDKIKDSARKHHQSSFIIQVLFMEKKIESLHITRSMQDRASQLSQESIIAAENILLITKLSNLSLELYSWYIKNGHARNESDEKQLTSYFHQNLPPNLKAVNNFYQKLYLYQSYCWYAFIRQDFLLYYRYTQKWVDLFIAEPEMIEVETAHYIKGMHNLLNAHFDLSNYDKFDEILSRFESFATSPIVTASDNNSIQVFVYLYIAKINRHFMHGTFNQGLELVSYIEEKLLAYSLYLDSHRILVFYYKIASLYFGTGNYDQAIDYLNKILNWKLDLRNDLQCYARLLHLIAHYELGNFDILEYLIKSVYRYMAKMENLSTVEVEVFKFLRNSFHLSPKEMKPAFSTLLKTLKMLEKNPLEARALSYLDIISWLESKVLGQSVDKIIREKYLKKAIGNSESRTSFLADS